MTDVIDDPLQRFRRDLYATAERCFQGNASEEYEAFAHRLSDACDPLLDALAPDLRPAALQIAIAYGYEAPSVREAGFGPAACTLTGIDVDCCHCGRHP
jgi:hypothetical protein